MSSRPDVLLAEIKKAEASRLKGRLKIFLGMCPGVGKTYAMLLAAQQRQEEGVNVLVGYIETHGRIETSALTAGLPRTPRRQIEHRGMNLEEMDIDAILALKPNLVLVDEFAHSNAPGSRHPKRWQDVVELLDAGIHVYTTLNVQHIESYRDVVAQITGIPSRECVPDSVIDAADEIELIDISPQELRKRLTEGKVYLKERAAAASESFFRDGNLKALREIALRVTAEKADRDLRDFMRSQNISGPWKSRERYLVAIGLSPFSEYLIRWVRRICTLTHGTWMAVFIDDGSALTSDERTRMDKNLSLARSLGAEVITVMGTDVTETLLRVARENNTTQIVVGKPLSHPLWDFLRGGSLVDKLIRRSGDIDVYVVRSEKSSQAAPPWFAHTDKPRLLREAAWGVLIVAIATAVGLLFRGSIGYMAVGLIYLLAVMFSSMWLSRWPILLTAALTALAWNYLFIVPYYAFYISNAHDIILFTTYFIVALFMGHFTSRLRIREMAERRREEQATLLYRFSRDVIAAQSLHEAIAQGVTHINTLFGAVASVFAPGNGGELSLIAGEPLDPNETAVAAWSFEKKQSAGRFTNTLPQSKGVYFPLTTQNDIVGVLGLKLEKALTLSERQLLETFAAQIALLIERERWMHQAEEAKVEEKSQHLQKTLLDSVSHEFKTPLSVISGAIERLETMPGNPAPLIVEIKVAAKRLHRIVANLLDITRIETGSIQPKAEWCDLREVIESASARVRDEMANRKVVVEIAEEVAICEVDAGLLEEILANLLRNAAQHSHSSSAVCVSASQSDQKLRLQILDEGPGVGENTDQIFDKFYRGQPQRTTGLGLGLSIVKGFVECLGGTISAKNRTDGTQGAQFEILLPVKTKSTQSIFPDT